MLPEESTSSIVGVDVTNQGTDYEQSALYENMPLERKRLGRYRWRFTEVMVVPPFATVVVDRTAVAGKMRGPALADGDACTFWLSSAGVDDLELETPVAAYCSYADYVEVELGTYAQSDGRPWSTILRARRCLAGYETVSWELALASGQPADAKISLGDHRLEVSEVMWASESPPELHVRFRLERGATSAGMTRG